MISRDSGIFAVAIVLSTIVHIVWANSRIEPLNNGYQESFVIPVSLDSRSSMQAEKQLEIQPVAKTIPFEPGSGDGYLKQRNQNELINKYLFYLREEIEHNKYQPPESRYYRLIGNVKVAIDILGNGSFSNIRISRSSGDALLDKTAFNAISHTNGTYKRPQWTGYKTLRAVFVLKYQYGL